jgi:hypothetical protein
MKYLCSNPECKKTFLHLAKQTLTYKPANSADYPIVLEKYCCPYCKSPDYDEEPTEPVKQQEVSNVYVYDLTGGAQIQLDKLLADGYVIVNRFSKQYHLEKPKTTESEKEA